MVNRSECESSQCHQHSREEHDASQGPEHDAVSSWFSVVEAREPNRWLADGSSRPKRDIVSVLERTADRSASELILGGLPSGLEVLEEAPVQSRLVSRFSWFSAPSRPHLSAG